MTKVYDAYLESETIHVSIYGDKTFKVECLEAFDSGLAARLEDVINDFLQKEQDNQCGDKE